MNQPNPIPEHEITPALDDRPSHDEIMAGDDDPDLDDCAPADPAPTPVTASCPGCCGIARRHGSGWWCETEGQEIGGHVLLALESRHATSRMRQELEAAASENARLLGRLAAEARELDEARAQITALRLQLNRLTRPGRDAGMEEVPQPGPLDTPEARELSQGHPGEAITLSRLLAARQRGEPWAWSGQAGREAVESFAPARGEATVPEPAPRRRWWQRR